MRLVFAFYIYFIASWVINLIQFISCDFAEPYREEVIKGLGVFLGLLSVVTVWF